ncbi:transposase family protein [Rothia sp. L_38]|uniref:transposase family protein n=1 Tax=Rothia sp. L_38 TaxID=3422315 RepID=UPI003D6A7CD1
MDETTLADKDYIGLGLLTPTERKHGVKTSKAVKDNNRVINRVRAVVERVIAQIKTWRIFHTGFPASFGFLWAGVFGGA